MFSTVEVKTCNLIYIRLVLLRRFSMPKRSPMDWGFQTVNKMCLYCFFEILLINSLLNHCLTRNICPSIRFLLFSGYWVCKLLWFLAPFRGQHYHLSTWVDENELHTPQEFSNVKHANVRNMVEKMFGLLINRWKFYLAQVSTI